MVKRSAAMRISWRTNMPALRLGMAHVGLLVGARDGHRSYTVPVVVDIESVSETWTRIGA